ncbi:MAG: HD domain-containing protein, partial [Nitrospirota bacterium]|nr:HD domain-containing protein [Nitrospirota bacterium]
MKLQIQDIRVQEALGTISRAVAMEGGRALLVGGCVRDTILGIIPKDYDVEVYGVQPSRIVEILSEQFSVSLVGEAFGVIKIHGLPIDVAIPRREFKVGRGYRGFEVQSDPYMAPEEAALRRDFTMNAMAFDPITQEIIDPYGGIQDLNNRILRHTSSKFGEDPLRVLRGQQLVARFNLNPTPETVELAKGLFHEYETLATERIWTEWFKWAAQSTKPSRGLHWLQETQWIQAYPELVALKGCPQDPRWHPEGDVWTHTLHVVDEAARIGERDQLALVDRATLVLAGLCHDLGKPTTTEVTETGVHSRGHAQTNEIYEHFLQCIGAPLKYMERVTGLCLKHLTHLDFVGSARHVRRLALSLSAAGETIDMLCRLVEADSSGRPPLPKQLPDNMHQIQLLSQELTVSKAGPQPLLLGRHLLDSGMQPGPQVGAILKAA